MHFLFFTFIEDDCSRVSRRSRGHYCHSISFEFGYKKVLYVPSLYCTQYLAFNNWLQLVVALLFTTLAIHVHVIFLFCSVPDGIIHSKFSKSCQVLVKILGDNASDGSPGLLRPVC